MRFVFHSWISIPQISEENARSQVRRVSVQSVMFIVMSLCNNQFRLFSEQEWCGLMQDKESACKLDQFHAYSEISFANFGYYKPDSVGQRNNTLFWGRENA